MLLKNFLFILSSIISTIILYLTTGNSIPTFLGSLFTLCHIPKNITFNILYNYLHVGAIQTVIPDVTLQLLRSNVDFLLFSFIISVWSCFWILKKNYKTIEIKILPNAVLFVILVFYLLEIQNIIYDAFFGEILSGLENSFFLKFIQFIIIFILISNIITSFYLVNSKNGWNIYLKLFCTGVLLLLSICACGYVCVFLINKHSALSFIMNNETRNLDELLNLLLVSYNIIPIAFCNPENIHPCNDIQQKMHDACYYSGEFSKIPFGGRTVRSAIIGTTVSPIFDIAEGCFKMKSLFLECMNSYSQEQAILRIQKNYIYQYTPKYTKPIITWPVTK
jgi:hypothetical protein